MNLLVLGANGRTGKLVTQLAKQRGHKVTGFVRGGSGLLPEVTYVQGDGENYQDILSAVKNIDVVVSTIGHVKFSDQMQQTNTMTNLIRAGEELNSNFKIVSLTGTGVRVQGDRITIIDRILNFGIKIIDNRRVTDGIQHFEVLKNSNSNWVVVRVLKLTNSNNNSYKLSLNGPAKPFVSRLEAASALLDAVETDHWDKSAPIVAKS